MSTSIGEVFLKADHGAKEDTMINGIMLFYNCLLYTSDAADD